MTAIDQAILVDGLEIHDKLPALVDDRTLAIVARRHRTSIVRRRGWMLRRLLAIADLGALCAAMVLAEWFVAERSGAGLVAARSEILAFIATLPAWTVAAKLYGLYDQDDAQTDHSTTDEFAAVFHMVTVCTWLVWALARVTGIVHPTGEKLLLFWGVAIGLVPAARAGARACARRSVVYLQNTVIVGSGEVGQLIAKKLLQHPEYGINIVGFVDRYPQPLDSDLDHLATLGLPGQLPAIVRLLDIERVIVAFGNESHQETTRLIRELAKMGVQVDLVPRLLETVGPNVCIRMLEGMPLLGIPPLQLSDSSALLKRTMDISISLAALAALSPALLAIALSVRLTSRGPVFYRHGRVGQGGRHIDVLKFRTMKLEACRGERYGGAAAERAFQELLADPERAREFRNSYKLHDDPRVTRVGGFLRRTSLDELPQLLNVIRGDLSLVGPRAVTEDELARYGDQVEDLLGVRPGITGYWQVNGRSRLSYEDRVRLDLSYIRSWSLRLDIAILGRTARTLLSRAGAV